MYWERNGNDMMNMMNNLVGWDFLNEFQGNFLAEQVAKAFQGESGVKVI